MDQHGSKKESIMRVHGGIQAIHGDIIVSQQQHGHRKTNIKINVARKQLDLVFISHLDGWILMHGMS